MPSNEARTDLFQRERQGVLRNSQINDRSHEESEKKLGMEGYTLILALEGYRWGLLKSKKVCSTYVFKSSRNIQ